MARKPKPLPPLGPRLKQLRDERALSQAQLALASGLHLSAITKIEQGVAADPGLDTLVKLARALQVTLDELVAFRL